MTFDSTKLIIDLDAIRHNMNAVKARANAPVMAVIKAAAYGHGAVSYTHLTLPTICSV